MPKRTQSVGVYHGQSPTANQLPPGACMPFGGVSAQIPDGFLIADGREVNRSDYPALNYLYSLGSYAYGAGNGTTTFNVPDLRGRTVAGQDNMAAATAGRITFAGSGIVGTTLGAGGGIDGVQLGHANIPSHTHTLNANTDMSHRHNSIQTSQPPYYYFVDGISGTVQWLRHAGISSNFTNNIHTHTMNYYGLYTTADAHSNMPPTGITYWIVKININVVKC